MFTGLIETVGTLSAIHPKDDVWKLDIVAPKIAGELRIGDSVSISGACSTVVRSDSRSFSVEIMEERLDSRLDGHIVSGHIDGLAYVSKIEISPKTRKYYFEAPPELLSGIVPKGSVAIDGISLTVIDVDAESFSVGIIPTTISDTTLSELKEGDAVNIETDMIGKYITKFLNARFSGAENTDEVKNTLTWDKLVKYGWV